MCTQMKQETVTDSRTDLDLSWVTCFSESFLEVSVTLSSVSVSI